jgi:uncharacterized protein
MAGPASIMRELHRLRMHAKELQDRIEQAPRLLKAQQARAARQEELFREAQDAIKHLKVKAHEKEVTIKTTQQLIKKYEKQLEGATSKKEYDSLKAEITAAKAKIPQIEDEILAAMEETEQRTAALPELEKAVKEAKAEAAQFEAEMQERLARLAEEQQRVVQAIAEAEAALPGGDLREKYDRLIRTRGEDALARVEGQTCTACYTGLTAQDYADLRQGQFMMCRSCGRILYLAE